MTAALQPGFGLMRDLTTTTGGGRDKRENILNRGQKTPKNYKEVEMGNEAIQQRIRICDDF